MPTHTTDVVAFRIKKEPLQQSLSVRYSGWIARAQTPIDFLESSLGVFGRILLQTLQDRIVHTNIDDLSAFHS